jgi:hypothetical protein
VDSLAVPAAETRSVKNTEHGRLKPNCSEGDLPALIPDDEVDDEIDSEIKDGDCIFVTALEQPLPPFLKDWQKLSNETLIRTLR